MIVNSDRRACRRVRRVKPSSADITTLTRHVVLPCKVQGITHDDSETAASPQGVILMLSLSQNVCGTVLHSLGITYKGLTSTINLATKGNAHARCTMTS